MKKVMKRKVILLKKEEFCAWRLIPRLETNEKDDNREEEDQQMKEVLS